MAAAALARLGNPRQKSLIVQSAVRRWMWAISISLPLRRSFSTLINKPVRRIESAKQLARRMAALPDTYQGE